MRPIILAVWAEEKAGKTTFALTFPRPLYHMDLDVGGFDRAIWRLDNKDIFSKSFPIPVQIEKMMGAVKLKGAVSVRFPKQVIGYKEVWQQIVVDFVAACQNIKVQTIVIDSATMLWSICHTSLLQEKQEIQLSNGVKTEDPRFRERLQPVEFPNDRMRSLIYTARSCKKNLVLTHYPKDVYASRATEKGIEEFRTGETTPDGFKDTQKLVDAVVKLEVSKKNEVTAVFTKCALEGMGMTAVGLTLPEASYNGIIELQKSMSGE